MAAATPQEAVTWWNLPNQLTLSRFGMAALLFVFISYQLWALCLVVFVVAAFTDWLDGFLARRWKMGTALGRNLDPLADKVLTCGAFIFLLPFGQADGWLLPWMTAVIVLRELIITSLRSFMETAGSKFGADWLGKIKMVLQCAALIAIFILLMTPREPAPTWAGLYWLTVALVYGTVLATLASGLQYIWRAVYLFGTAPGT
jgi:CDP-diacylglycerol---glycerol-3-phosphate 3-phosphatidyltransferase